MVEALRRHPLRIAIIVFAFAVSATVAFLLMRPNITGATPSAERFPVRGIDISAHNGIVDFDSVKASGIEFVILKATEGGNWTDRMFAENYERARRAGLKIGAYHFFRFDRPGIPQAINVYNALWNRHLDLPLAVDVEKAGNPKGVPADSISARLHSFVRFLEKRGVGVMFYTNKTGYHEFIAPDFSMYPLWLCSFSNSTSNEHWTFWQFTHSGRVAGVEGDVDMNVFNGTLNDFNKNITNQIWTK